jgi:hypothetical protein
MIGMRLLLLTSLLFASTSAMPAVVFPFNSQVPTAARVSQLYSFQFSASTFAPGDASFIYSLSGQPAWLTLDGASRTLTGTPGQSDTGSSEFILTAADSTGAAHMVCTLVVVTDPLPTLQGNLGEQLAESTNLSSSDPPIMTLLPNSAFDFHFRQKSFIDIVQRNLYYYATLSDHTPLPSWLHFDGANLAFSGVAPQLSAFPQSFQVVLIASDVQGFAGSSSTFTIRVGETQLVFVPEEQDVKFEPGKPLDEEDLGNTLLSNGVKVDVARLKEVDMEGLPGWMTFDNKTLKLQGDAPDNAQAANATLTVKDENGDTAVLVVRLAPEGDSSSLFTGEIGTLDATSGESFEYTIPTSVIADSDATLMLILPTEARWLQFDSGKRELKGEVPTQTSSIITATLNARAPNSAESETLIFKIDIKAAASSSSSTATVTATTLVTSRAAPTASSTSTAAAALATDTESRNGLSGGAIAGIVIGVILAVVILFALLFLCCRRKRRREGYEKHTSTSKQTISRPIPVPDTSSIAVETTMQRDVEKAESMEEERAPQIALNLPPRSARNSKWTGRFSRVSLVSSLGNGENMIRADSNIPEWGHESAVLQMPHESFSVPAQLARVSRQLSDLSPSKGALRRLRVKRGRPHSEDDVGLGIGMGGANLSPHRAESRRKASSMGFEDTMDRSSCGSFTTRGTSMLSTRPSDFPRPPTQESFVESRSFLVGADNKRKSVRLVPRSDSVSNNDRTLDDNANDERSMQEKRQSFIRKRASTTLSSPLWSATIGTHRGNGQSSTSDIDVVSGANSRKSKRIKSQLTSYSESSSIQPSRSSNRISRRFRSSFAPNFPRAITRSTLAADDDNEDNWTTSSESSSSEDDDRLDAEAEMELADEMALPRHERSWVLPNEASPTPPPPSNHQPSSHRRQRPPIHRASTPNSAIRKTKPWNTTGSTATSSRSISPLAIQALENNTNNTYSRSNSGGLSSPTKLYPRSRLRRSRLSEPMALTAADSLSRVNPKSKSKPKPKETATDNDSDFVTTDPDNNNNNNTKTGPRLAFTKTSRPISVDEDAKRMSSMRAERVLEEEGEQEADVRGGALREEIERSLERSRVFTGGSGKGFI